MSENLESEYATLKILSVLVLVIVLTGLSDRVNAQACGNTFITIYVNDSRGKPIRNAEITVSGMRNGLVSWNNVRNAYFGMKGLWGGNRDVEIKVITKDYEKFQRKIDMSLGWRSSLLILRRKGTREKASFTPLAHFNGIVSDEDDVMLDDVQVSMTDESGKHYQTAAKPDGLRSMFPSAIIGLSLVT